MMRYLFLMMSLPWTAAAQSNLKITASQCNTDVIQISLKSNHQGPYEISRKRNKEPFSWLATKPQMPFNDRSSAILNHQVFYYQVKVGDHLSNIAGGYTCVHADVPAILPYQKSNKILQIIDYQWSALQNIERYQLQVSRAETDFSLETGFQKSQLLLDTVLTTNYCPWKATAAVGDTLYWMVRGLGANKTFYFINPIMNKIVADEPFANAPQQDLKLGEIKFNKNKISILVENKATEPLKNLQLHYFVSETAQFTPNAKLIASQLLQDLPIGKKQKMVQNLNTKGLKGYILVVPTVEGVFMGAQQFVSKPF
jgi:hypothetical protein